MVHFQTRPGRTGTPVANPTGGPAVRRTGRSRTRWAGRIALRAAAVVVLAAGTLFLASGTAGSSVAQPPPTSTPQAPGIAVIAQQPIDLPDPMMVAAGGRYHVYLSTAFGDTSQSNVPELVGTPGRWGRPFDAMPAVPSWAEPARSGGKVWDPFVQKVGKRYLLYFSAVLRWAGPTTHCLGVAASADARGPFVPVAGPPIVCQPDQGGDIDVQPFHDTGGPDGPDHPWYLIWKSDNNNLRPIRPTLIWAAPLSNDGLTLTGTARVIYRADLPWQKPVLEAPQMVSAPDGSTWLFYSAGTGFATPGYAMGVAACDGPLGGCHDYGTRPLVATNDQGAGPGEETVFIAPDGSYWLLYNPWHTGLPFMLFRPAEGVRIGWDVNGPYVGQAGVFPSPSG